MDFTPSMLIRVYEFHGSSETVNHGLRSRCLPKTILRSWGEVRGEGMSIRKRKMEHVEVTLFGEVEGYGETLLSDVILVHKAIPGIDFNEVDTSTTFLGKKIRAPLLITGMTGGSEDLARINSTLAQVAEEEGIGIGVGSQRIAIENPEVKQSFSVVRKMAPSVPVIANIGFAQLEHYTATEFKYAIEMIEADAIAIHLNAAQEVFQPEGDTNYSLSLVDKLAEVARELGVPVIIKETGCGISMETASLLREKGIKIFDVSGAGGTSWIAVEMIRGKRRSTLKAESAGVYASWGIPTAASIIEVRYSASDSVLIGSGGLRNGLDVVKAISLGADLAGMALPMLRNAMMGKDKLKEFVERTVFEIKAGMFLTGARTLRDLHKIPLIVSGRLRDWLSSRGVDWLKYDEIRKGLDGTRGLYSRNSS
jgi:isopentenyl-diphosphate delta-isomerase